MWLYQNRYNFRGNVLDVVIIFWNDCYSNLCMCVCVYVCLCVYEFASTSYICSV